MRLVAAYSLGGCEHLSHARLFDLFAISPTHSVPKMPTNLNNMVMVAKKRFTFGGAILSFRSDERSIVYAMQIALHMLSIGIIRVWRLVVGIF